MVILHIAGLSDKKYAGPNINVPNNVIYSEKIAKVGLYNTGNKCLENLKKITNYFEKGQMQNYDVKTLPQPFNNPDIVIFQSMYLMEHVKIAQKLIKNNIPYIIVPRGALTQKAQKIKRYKKIPANILIFNKYVRKANGIQFLTENEYKESRAFKFNNYFICGNGDTVKDKKKIFEKREENEFKVTFIGRLDIFHKGLDVLTESINKGKDFFRKNKIFFEIYGPDNDNSVNELTTKINEYEINDLMFINGPVYEQKKEKILLDSDLFIHTSRLEGHPTAIIEAISYGIPVLVTPGTNMDNEVKNNELGYVANFDSEDIKDKIILAYNERAKFEEISKKEIEFAHEHYSWEKVMEEAIKGYRNMIAKEK